MQRRDFNDHPLVRAMTWVADLIILNLLWILCSLPVVTIGASFSAMYTVTLKLIRREPVRTIRDFFIAFKESFKPATPIWLLGVLGVAIFGADLWFSLSQNGFLKVLFIIISVIVGTLSFSLLSWSFPLIAQFENSIKSYIINSLAMAFCNPLVTVGIWICYAVPVLIALFLPANIVVVIGFMYIFMGVSGPCALATLLVMKGFAKMDDRLRAQDQEDNEQIEGDSL